MMMRKNTLHTLMILFALFHYFPVAAAKWVDPPVFPRHLTHAVNSPSGTPA